MNCNRGRAVLAGLVFELLNQPRFANTGLPTEQWELALTRLRYVQRSRRDPQLVFSTG